MRENALQAGSHVRLTTTVERYPHFRVPAGRTGVVTELSDEQISLRLDEPVEGAEEWDHEIHWYSGMFTDEDFRDVFAAQVELVE